MLKIEKVGNQMSVYMRGDPFTLIHEWAVLTDELINKAIPQNARNQFYKDMENLVRTARAGTHKVQEVDASDLREIINRLKEDQKGES